MSGLHRVLPKQLDPRARALAVSLLCGACEQALPDLAAQPGTGTASTRPFQPGVVPDASASDAAIAPSPTATSSAELPPAERPGADEPERDPAFVLLHGLTDARYVYVCPEAEPGQVLDDAEPAPPTGLSYGQTWIQSEESFDFDAALSWWLIATDERLAEGTSCGKVWQLSLEAQGCASDVTTSDEPPFDGGSFDADGGQVDTERDGSGLDGAQLDGAQLDGGGSDWVGQSDSSLDAGVSCAASPRMAPFASFAAGSFVRAKSSLLVAAGCIGPVSSAWAQPCGVAQATPSALRSYWVPLSRLTVFDAVGLQFLNASNLERAALRSSPDEGEPGAYFSVASDVGIGEIAPTRLHAGVKLADFGSDLERVHLRVEEGFGSEPLLTQTWSDTLGFSGQVELRNGAAYSLVLLGPVASDAIRPRGNPVRVVLIDNDPARPLP